MRFRIGKFDADTHMVPVTFRDGDIVHRREVNAVLTDDGGYDRAATRARVQEVANGVANKIALGLITSAG